MHEPVNSRDTSASTPEPRSLAGWYAVFVLSLGLLLSFTDRLIINLVVDPIRADLALTDVQVSLLQGAGFALIYAVAGLPSGRLADTVSRRNLIALGVLVWSAATGACGLAHDFWTFFAARLAVGLGEAVLVPAASSLILDLFSPRRRGVALGIFSLGAVVGSGLALLAGGVLLRFIAAGQFAAWPIGKLADWRQLMILAALPGFVLLPFLMLIQEPLRHHRSGLLPLADMMRQLTADNGAVLRVCLVKGILAAGDYGLISWMPTLLQRRYAFSPLAVGSVLALAVSLSGAFASVAGGAASDLIVRRWGLPSRVALLLGCYPLTLLGALGVLLAGTGQQAGAALAIWAFGSISGYVIGQIVMQEWVPSEMRATTLAVSITSTSLVGVGLGPTLVALVAKHGFGGEQALQAAMGTVGLISGSLALLLVWSPARRGLAALRERKFQAARPPTRAAGSSARSPARAATQTDL